MIDNKFIRNFLSPFLFLKHKHSADGFYLIELFVSFLLLLVFFLSHLFLFSSATIEMKIYKTQLKQIEQTYNFHLALFFFLNFLYFTLFFNQKQHKKVFEPFFNVKNTVKSSSIGNTKLIANIFRTKLGGVKLYFQSHLLANESFSKRNEIVYNL